MDLYLAGLAHSFFLRDGSVGTNLSFCDPCLVTSEGFLAKLPMAFGTDGPGVPDGVEDAPALLVDMVLSAMKPDKYCEKVTQLHNDQHGCAQPRVYLPDSFDQHTAAVTPSSQFFA